MRKSTSRGGKHVPRVVCAVKAAGPRRASAVATRKLFLFVMRASEAAPPAPVGTEHAVAEADAAAASMT